MTTLSAEQPPESAGSRGRGRGRRRSYGSQDVLGEDPVDVVVGFLDGEAGLAEHRLEAPRSTTSAVVAGRQSTPRISAGMQLTQRVPLG